MEKNELVSIIRKMHLADDLDSGPVAAVISVNNKKIHLQVTKSGDHILISTGKVFRRKMRIPIGDI